MSQIDLPYVSIRYEEPIVYLTFKGGCELGFPEMQELVACAEKLSGNKPYVVFSDVRENVSVTPAGRRYSSQAKNSPLQRGTAVLVNNVVYQLAVDLFLTLQGPEFPYNAFTDKQKAIDWLLSLKLDEKVGSQ